MQLDSVSDLWETKYGRLLLAKVALVLPLLALGAYNNRFSVPRIAREIASRVEQRRFLRVAGAELGLMTVVVGADRGAGGRAAGEGEGQAQTAAPPPASPAQHPFAADGPIGRWTMNLVVDPARPGRNAMHLFVGDRRGTPIPISGASYEASLPSREHRAASASRRSASPSATTRSTESTSPSKATGRSSCASARASSTSSRRSSPCPSGRSSQLMLNRFLPVVGAALVLAPAAAAHITANPSSAPAGSFAVISLRVPHGVRRRRDDVARGEDAGGRPPGHTAGGARLAGHRSWRASSPSPCRRKARRSPRASSR